MNKNRLNILCEEPGWEQTLPGFAALSQKVFDTVAAFVKENEDIAFLNDGKPLDVNLSLSSDTAIHRLNLEFRGMDKPTNVLSFANLDDPDFEAGLAQSSVVELGDIMIALETMQRESAAQNISFHDHYCHLLTHGLLHLLGFDHQEDDEAEYMEDFEIKILALLNIDNPYKE